MQECKASAIPRSPSFAKAEHLERPPSNDSLIEGLSAATARQESVIQRVQAQLQSLERASAADAEQGRTAGLQRVDMLHAEVASLGQQLADWHSQADSNRIAFEMLSSDLSSATDRVTAIEKAAEAQEEALAHEVQQRKGQVCYDAAMCMRMPICVPQGDRSGHELVASAARIAASCLQYVGNAWLHTVCSNIWECAQAAALETAAAQATLRIAQLEECLELVDTRSRSTEGAQHALQSLVDEVGLKDLAERFGLLDQAAVTEDNVADYAQDAARQWAEQYAAETTQMHEACVQDAVKPLRAAIAALQTRAEPDGGETSEKLKARVKRLERCFKRIVLPPGRGEVSDELEAAQERLSDLFGMVKDVQRAGWALEERVCEGAAEAARKAAEQAAATAELQRSVQRVKSTADSIVFEGAQHAGELAALVERVTALEAAAPDASTPGAAPPGDEAENSAVRQELDNVRESLQQLEAEHRRSRVQCPEQQQLAARLGVIEQRCADLQQAADQAQPGAVAHEASAGGAERLQAMQHALGALSERHDALRAAFDEQRGAEARGVSPRLQVWPGDKHAQSGAQHSPDAELAPEALSVHSVPCSSAAVTQQPSEAAVLSAESSSQLLPAAHRAAFQPCYASADALHQHARRLDVLTTDVDALRAAVEQAQRGTDAQQLSKGGAADARPTSSPQDASPGLALHMRWSCSVRCSDILPACVCVHIDHKRLL